MISVHNHATNEKKIFANSRYRVKVHADAAGGAYVRSRIKISDGTHGSVPSAKTDVDYRLHVPRYPDGSGNHRRWPHAGKRHHILPVG